MSCRNTLNDSSFMELCFHLLEAKLGFKTWERLNGEATHVPLKSYSLNYPLIVYVEVPLIVKTLNLLYY